MEQISLDHWINNGQVVGHRPTQENSCPREIGHGNDQWRSIRIVTKLRNTADGMTKHIEAKRNPAIATQNLTQRRARIAASMANDADMLEKVQSALNALADAHENGTIPLLLKHIKTKAEVETLLYSHQYPKVSWDEKGRKRLQKLNINDESSLKKTQEALESMVVPVERDPKIVLLKEKERNLIGCKLPGYFPTPKEIVQQMIDYAGIEEGMSVLEPSAGKGNIVDMIREQHPKNSLVVIERSSTLRDILELKGYTLSDYDFFEHTAKYDRILQNPPFEHGQDIDHLWHAYDCLNPGGRVVSIMSDGPFFHNDKKSQEFRDWLNLDVYGSSITLGNGFEHGERPTGVSSRLVFITKQND